MEQIKTDFLVVGSGTAGLRAALTLAEKGDVLVATKGAISDSNTEYAQGGVAAVLSDEDRIALHYEDTIRAGDGLSDEISARILVEEGPKYIRELIEWGAEFERDGGKLHFTREGAHSARRVLHAGGDSTGREVMRVLKRKCAEHQRIKVAQTMFALGLLVEDEVCVGASFLADGGKRVTVFADKTLLATGGAGRVFRETTNPPFATGDGTAIAYRAGAELMNMEFVQFHPTALFLPNTPRFLLTEALRGEGGILLTKDGELFMKKYHPDGDLAPRDVVSRAIVTEAKKSDSPNVYLDATALGEERLKKRFPVVHSTCLTYGIDIARERIPIYPAAHYIMGGVKTDTLGRTVIKNLYAAGEVACNGVHGANRLASNSLLEGLVFGARVGVAMKDDETVKKSLAEPADEHLPTAFDDPENVCGKTQNIAWEKIGIIRCEKSLVSAVALFRECAEQFKKKELSAKRAVAANLLLNAYLIAQSALLRRESRGAHYRTDFPEKVEAKGAPSFIDRTKAGFSC